MCNLYWTKWHWSRLHRNISVSPANCFTDCFSLSNISNLGLVQLAKLWAMYKVDSISLHLEEFGARDSIVVRALSYKPEGRGFETR
jgi:hypothetical protein